MKTKLLFTFIHSFLLLSAIVNATNNTTYTSIVLSPVANPVDDLIACDDGIGIGFNEITGIGAGFTSPTFIDTDENGVQNYLDNDDDGDLVLTIDEDYNNSGSPLDDDLNTNNIPDFLDSAVALATEDFEANSFMLYPNPTSSIITIESLSIIEDVRIYDHQGRLVKEFPTISNRELTIDIAGFSTGVYFIRINNLAIQKFVKN